MCWLHTKYFIACLPFIVSTMQRSFSFISTLPRIFLRENQTKSSRSFFASLTVRCNFLCIYEHNFLESTCCFSLSSSWSCSIYERLNATGNERKCENKYFCVKLCTSILIHFCYRSCLYGAKLPIAMRQTCSTR